MPDLVEGVDYYFNAEGLFVMTATYLLKRGFCCSNGCLHCPYNKTEKQIDEEE